MKATNRLRILGTAAVLTLSGALPLTASTQAGASPWSGSVYLTGHAHCFSPTDRVAWVYVKDSDGEQGWASHTSGLGQSTYGFQFTRIPGGSTTATVTWGCSLGSYMTSFGLARPTVGGSASRNVCPSAVLPCT
ncbi:hypothetical protein ABIA33_007579 [Streptacidiphilus sp. MAP12-16]|uniref:hypothetical protein n=1 Tax=Streptacidiphilus sp. MAP12-16 TaxID=3156300 RepID=UPI0035155F66